MLTICTELYSAAIETANSAMIFPTKIMCFYMYNQYSHIDEYMFVQVQVPYQN